MTYAVAEPDRVEAYVDQAGTMHRTREAAIDANFARDVIITVNTLIGYDATLRDVPAGSIHELVKAFISSNPDMVRVMLGDRDAT